MKKLLSLFFLIGFIFMSVNLKASITTRHQNINKIIFEGDGKILNEITDEQVNETKEYLGKKLFGWKTAYFNYKRKVYSKYPSGFLYCLSSGSNSFISSTASQSIAKNKDSLPLVLASKSPCPLSCTNVTGNCFPTDSANNQSLENVIMCSGIEKINTYNLL